MGAASCSETVAGSASVAEMRQRAFTLFVRTYDELRRAMSFLRWHEGDVDEIIPSLYAGRGGRGKRAEEEPTEPTPVVVAPTPVSDDPEDKPPARPNVGMPGSDPFVSWPRDSEESGNVRRGRGPET